MFTTGLTPTQGSACFSVIKYITNPTGEIVCADFEKLRLSVASQPRRKLHQNFRILIFCVTRSATNVVEVTRRMKNLKECLDMQKVLARLSNQSVQPLSHLHLVLIFMTASSNSVLVAPGSPASA